MSRPNLILKDILMRAILTAARASSDDLSSCSLVCLTDYSRINGLEL